MSRGAPPNGRAGARGSGGSRPLVKVALRGKILTPVGRAGRSFGMRYLADGLLVVGDDGRIASVEPFAPDAVRGVVRDLRPNVILPGFVDAHLHFPQTRIIGSASGPLLEWLERSVFPEEARFQDLEYAREVAREFVARMIAAGTTTCAAFSSSSPAATGVLLEAFAASGMRAVAGLTLMDQECPEPLRLSRDAAIGASRDLIARWHGHDRGRVSFAITPRFALSCSRRLMEAAAQLAADHDLVVQTHVAETPREGAATLEAHPYAADYLDVYDRVGLLGRRTVLAHAIHLSPREWDKVAERGASVAHCPDSNFFLGSGRMKLGEAERRAIPVALGSDVAAGRSFSMRRAMASAYDNALCADQRVTPADLFAMATLGGARALGLEESIGTLEAGKDADVVVLDVPAHLEGEAEVLGHVAFASDSTHVLRTMVRGAFLQA